MVSFIELWWNFLSYAVGMIRCWVVILAEFLNLTIEDVGKVIELVYTPVRNDGIRGNPRSVISEVIAPGK